MSNSSVAISDPTVLVSSTWLAQDVANITRFLRVGGTDPPTASSIRALEANNGSTVEYSMDVPLITDITQIKMFFFAGATTHTGNVDMRIDGSLVGSQADNVLSGTAWSNNTFTGTWDREQLQQQFNWVFDIDGLGKAGTWACSAIYFEFTGRKLFPNV